MNPNECFLDIMPVEAAIAARPEWDSDFTQAVYKHWVSAYIHRSGLYYRMRYQNQVYYLRGLFARDTGISIDDGFDSETREMWDAFCERHGLDRYHQLMQSAFNDFRLYEDKPDSDALNYISNHDVLKRLMEHFEMIQRGELAADMPFVYESLWGVWFDYIIDNTPDEAKRLRALPYPEYLKTDHWLRVRTAMLIAHRSRCQSKACEGHDSYLGDEKWLHVHHLTYKNRGNERFSDLTLLCDECHKQAHKDGKS